MAHPQAQHIVGVSALVYVIVALDKKGMAMAAIR